MPGFLLRLLPFWVREPLLIAIGSVLGVRVMYLAFRDDTWVAAGLAVVFLALTGIRVRAVVRALRARRDPDRAAPSAGVAADAAAQPQAQLRSQLQLQPETRAPAAPGARTARDTTEKEPNAWGQAVAAVAVFGALALALWAGPRLLPSDDKTPQSASCSRGTEELPKAYGETTGVVTGDELCEALNRPDLAQLLGTPEEIATAASGSNDTAWLTDGKVAQPEAEVTFDTYTVNVSATYNELSIAQYVKLLRTGGEADFEPLDVLGRPAVLSSDHTMRFSISLDGAGSGGPVEQGPLARTLSVALDRGDRGGYYDITVWSTSGALPDDSVLLGVAEKVLPTIPERAA
ncbi:DUF6215 domain-containing protein [Streptomyces sp. DH41]|uniref:DUF6215 domain-containing protein n=1 Tax=Streptomyces sp. DH41 TaxID=3040125 RepID=UPI00244294CC|nr:DUF6215 domain-containing protein [Streptomyces sp. DH41]MDG9722996.1 DUF6215 domain-containing protein [Streptomyces sp. DH41]